MMEEKAMFRIRKQKALYQEKPTYEQNLIEELEKIYDLNANFGASRDSAYLEGNTELEIAINKILELKNTQVREQFLLNSELIEYVTNMTYIKDMVDHISIQKKSINNITSTSEDMSTSSEEIANYVQDSFVKTKGAVDISEDALKKINHSFTYIDQSFHHMRMAQTKIQSAVKATKEIDVVVNIIKEVAEKTNLLSLNASIEAARSGDSGRGFAVVANEIKKLAQSTKESVSDINNMLNHLHAEIDQSNEKIIEAIDVFSSGKEHITAAVDSIGHIEKSLGEMNSIFDHISANVEEQSAATQEVSARLNEINDHTCLLNDIILRTGQGIYSISTMAENLRVSALPYFKDFKGNHMFIPVTAEHLLWKWKAYNAVCGFVKIDENSIQGHDQCTFGKFSANNNVPDDMKKLIEPHEQIHRLAKQIVRAVNMGERDHLNDDLKKLDLATDQFTEGLKNIKF